MYPPPTALYLQAPADMSSRLLIYSLLHKCTPPFLSSLPPLYKILGELAGTPDKSDWRFAQLDKGAEERLAEAAKATFGPFEPSA